MERNDKIQKALQKQRSKTTASMEFYGVFKASQQNKPDKVFKQSDNAIKAPKIGLWLAVDNTGLKLYLRKGKVSFSEQQANNWLQKQGIKE